ncbi:MAG: DUF4190 domain-containing protein [Akkermansiaceae bacterium]|nr:DUF4190 domain-containing protein [Akkermansiaceae bacterium]
MIIFGTTGKTSVEKKGFFHCPACGEGASYQQKGIRRYFTLFFVPLIPLHKVGDIVECDRCGGSFKPEVLTWGGIVPQGAGGPPPIPGGVGIASPPPIPGASRGAAATVSYQSNGLAKASMILGVIGLLTSFLLCPSILFVALGLVFGFIGLSRAKKGGGVVGGRGQAMTGIVCSALGLLVGVVFLLSMSRSPSKEPSEREPWQQAAMKVSSSSKNEAFGNTPEAVELARKYGAMMAGLHAVSFESSKGSKRTPRYVVHCELHEGSCAFLACVPEYRKFTDDAKESLEELAWTTASIVAADDPAVAERDRLCVSLKGLVMFGSVMTGEVGSEHPETKSKDEEEMAPFFPKAEDDSTGEP